MNTKYINKLEYNKVIQIVSNYCKTYIGKEILLNLKPSFQASQVERLLLETTEAVNLAIRKASSPICDIPNISIWLKQLESYNSLSMKALLDIAHILKISREIKEYFFSDENFDTSSFPLLFPLFDSIYTNKGIEEKFFNLILDENTIADNASSKLSNLRKQSQKLEQILRDKLNSFIHSSTYSKYIMEPIITIRNSRYVIPIKEEYKNSVKGFIHDVSSSGSTVFIEPITVFELNNQIANIKMEELTEIQKILQELSSCLYPYIDMLKSNIKIIGELDVIFAKSNYSININGIMPTINEQKQLNLIEARHPLISPNTVVPIDISIGEKYDSLVITGPNTGGKTVALKTVGLLLLMAYSGIYIPCKENSSIYIFSEIFADIGDEQSIQESLSTFSAHMANIIEIINNSTSNSLILLDELGSGTDPVEGANLAISILQNFHRQGSTVISTTHYQELKHYCLLTKGFENASFEFDLENLQPTYKLLIGIPGKSNAFAISKKLGLNQDIIDCAISFIEKDSLNIEELMKNIYDNKIIIEKEKEEIEKNSNQISKLREELEKQSNKLKEKEDLVIKKAQAEAREILLSAKEQASKTIKELNSLSYGETNKANNIRNEINNKLNSISSNSDNGLDIEKLKAFNEKFNLKNNKKNNQFNNTKVSFSKDSNFKSQNISSEINVIGFNVEEAIFTLDKYLDNCTIAKLSPIRIVHGKGTGKLRKGIHNYLKTNPHVLTFRLGTFGEGEMGVTVVELKK